MYLKELVLESERGYARGPEFGLSANCVTDLYFDSLPKKTDTSPFGKIIIEAAADAAGIAVENLINVVVVRVPFDFDRYWSADTMDRKRQILDLIGVAISFLVQKFSWDAAIFAEAREKVLAKDFVNKGFWRKPVQSPTKKRKAQLYMDHSPDEIKLDVVIRKRGGQEVLRRYLTSVTPHWFFIDDTIGPIKWLDENTVAISTRDGKQTWMINVP